MAKKKATSAVDFAFGANASKPNRPKSGKAGGKKGGSRKGGGGGGRGAWTAYIGGGVSNLPIPD